MNATNRNFLGLFQTIMTCYFYEAPGYARVCIIDEVSQIYNILEKFGEKNWDDVKFEGRIEFYRYHKHPNGEEEKTILCEMLIKENENVSDVF